MRGIKNAEVIQLKTINGKLMATLSYQDQTQLGDINNGYVSEDIPVNIRLLQIGAHGGVRVDQSINKDEVKEVSKCEDFVDNGTTAMNCKLCGNHKSTH